MEIIMTYLFQSPGRAEVKRFTQRFFPRWMTFQLAPRHDLHVDKAHCIILTTFLWPSSILKPLLQW